MAQKKKIVVVGSGPGGAASAALLAHRGFDVTLFERKETLGGRSGRMEIDGFRFDIGPTFLMMKFLLDSVFKEAGGNAEDFLTFYKLDPMYELRLGDRIFKPSPDYEKTHAEIEKIFPGHGHNLERFLKTEKKRFHNLIPCIQRDYSKAHKLLSWQLMKSVPYLSLGKSVFDVLKGYFHDDDLALMFSFQSKYLGMSAWDCPGGFAMLSFIEHGYGVYHTEGGLSEIPHAFINLAENNGAKIVKGCGVKQLLLSGRDVIGVELDNGDQVHCDSVVLNADFAHAMTNIVPQGTLKKYGREKLDKKKYSCSTFMMHLGLNKVYNNEHHTIVFANNYRKNVEDVFNRHVLSEDFSFYVRNASINDSTLAPKGKSSLYVLVPVPNLDASINWENTKTTIREQVLTAMESRLDMKDIRSAIEVERIVTPLDWRDQLSVYKGATFNLAHNLGQLAYWRPRNEFEELGNCFLVGGGTHPGSGLPTILESARISANLISKKYKVPFNTFEMSA